MKNREKFNNMTNEELSIFLEKQQNIYFDNCANCVARDYCANIPHYQFTSCKNVIKKWLDMIKEVEE